MDREGQTMINNECNNHADTGQFKYKDWVMVRQIKPSSFKAV